MGRKIDITLNGKDYTIEYNREAVMRLMEKQSKATPDSVDLVIDFIYFGLIKNHRDEMPARDDIVSFLVSIDEPQKFVEEVSACIQETVNVIESEKKQGNSKWGVRK